jgi:hypothetical protein
MENIKNPMDCYNCNICNKQYSSYKSLWNHNKEFHKINNTKVTSCSSKVVHSNLVCSPISNPQSNLTNNELDKKETLYSCRYCIKQYSNRQNRWKHEQKCNIINENNLELDKIKEETKQKEVELLLKKEELLLKKEEAKILQLKLKLQKADKVDNITLNKLNKMLLKHNNRIKNSTVNSNNTINNINNVQNNFQLVGFGKEEITEVLTNNEKKLIMNSKYGCLEKLIEIVHCGKYNQFKNVILTNMKDNYMYKYDDTKGCFVLGTKSEIMNSLVDGKLFDLDVIYNDLLEKNKIDEKTKNCIEDFVNRIHNNDEKFTDIEGKQHDDYKHYKISEIKLLLFNNQDKITNDISLLLST